MLAYSSFGFFCIMKKPEQTSFGQNNTALKYKAHPAKETINKMHRQCMDWEKNICKPFI